MFLLLVSCIKIFAQTPCVNGMAGIYPCNHVDLQKFMSMSDLGGGASTNDIWGWTSPFTNKEYALVGKSNGTAFVDMTDPVNPIYLGELPTHTFNSLWRGIKVYNNYAFIVSEAEDHGMQVMNLMQLDTLTIFPVTFLEDAHYAEFGNCHTIAVNEETGYVYCTGSNTYNGGLHVVNVADPLNPVFAGGFEQDGYSHECQSVVYTGPDLSYVGSEITVGYNENTITVINTTDKTDMTLVSRIGYPSSDSTYTHQGWFTKDQKYILMNDELDELNLGTNTRTHIWDMIDLDNPVYMGFYLYGNPSIDHNLYIINNVSYNSNYSAGLRILDITDIADADLKEIAFFDVIPSNNLPEFVGTWSNYPFFASTNIPLTSIDEGIFIVKPRLIYTKPEQPSIYCNQDSIAFEVETVLNLFGSVEVSISGLPAGVEYYLDGNTMVTPGIGILHVINSNLITDASLSVQITLFNTDTAITIDVVLINSTDLPNVALLQLPLDNSILASNVATLQWTNEAATNSLVEISLTSDFAIIQNSYLLEGLNSLVVENLNSNTLYFWRVKNANGCAEAIYSEISIFTTATVISVFDLEEARNDIRIFPNPSTGKFYLEGVEANQEVNVLDVTGKVVKTLQISTNKFLSIDLSSIEKGIYFLKFTKQNIVKKILVK